jgi:hypothetical protein
VFFSNGAAPVRGPFVRAHRAAVAARRCFNTFFLKRRNRARLLLFAGLTLTRMELGDEEKGNLLGFVRVARYEYNLRLRSRDFFV